MLKRFLGPFKFSLFPYFLIDEWDFWKMWMLGAFGGKSWEPDFLTYFEYAESDKPDSQAKLWVLDHLICINKMAAKLPLLQQCQTVSFYKSVTKRTKWTTEMSLSMKWTSVNRIGSVLRLKWFAIFINMQISGQICQIIAINVEIPFLLIISVKKELKCLFNEINPINLVPKLTFEFLTI